MSPSFIPPLVPVALAFIAGILLAWFVPAAPTVLLGIGSLFGTLSLIWRKRQGRGFIALLLLWLCLGALRTIIWQHQPANHVARLVAEEPAPVLVHGIVVNDPVELFAPQEGDHRVCVVKALAIRHEGHWAKTHGLIRAKLHDVPIPLAYGDELLIEGELFSPPSPGNPGQFDWRAYLARQGIHVLLRVQPYHGVVVLQTHRGNRLIELAYHLKARWRAMIQQTFHEPYAGLLLALLLGERVQLSEELRQALIDTGTIHLIAISGFNVGIVAWLIGRLLTLLCVPYRVRLGLTAGALSLYCVITGMQPPVVRATIMAWIVLGGLLLEREIDWFNTLAAAALGILCVNPSQLFDAGFQLSFGSVLSLLMLTPRLYPVIEPRLVWIPPPVARRYLAAGISASLAIWIGLWPIIAWYFHLFSPVSLLANLLLVPLVSALVAIGTGALMVSLLLSPILAMVSWVVSGLVMVTTALVHWCDSIPFGFWPMAHPPWWLMGACYALVALWLFRQRLRVAEATLLILTLLAIGVWLWSRAVSFGPGMLSVTVLDVGHGDSIVIQAPTGQTLLIDGGARDQGTYTVLPFLRYHGIQRLDGIVVTHPDEDHLGGIASLLATSSIGRLFDNGTDDATLTSRDYNQLAASRRLGRSTLVRGQQLMGIPGLSIDVLHPPQGLLPGIEPASNDNSLVIQLAYGQVRLLFCGDIDERGLPALLRWGSRLRSTVLLVPHHGSRLGPLQSAFFRTVAPEVAVVSVGHAHDLPTPEVLDDLSRVGAMTYLTRDAGAVTLRTDGRQLLVQTFRNRTGG